MNYPKHRYPLGWVGGISKAAKVSGGIVDRVPSNKHTEKWGRV